MFFVQLYMVGVIACIAVIYDLVNDKIPNELIVVGYTVGIFYQVIGHRWVGVVMFLVGTIVPLALLFGLFALRMLGAGDIKLLSVLGGFLGKDKIFMCILAAFLIGAVISACLILIHRNFLFRLQYLAEYLTNLLRTRDWKPYYRAEHTGHTIHFSVPILISIILYMGGVY